MFTQKHKSTLNQSLTKILNIQFFLLLLLLLILVVLFNTLIYYDFKTKSKNLNI